jgi:hypothetical protein
MKTCDLSRRFRVALDEAGECALPERRAGVARVFMPALSATNPAEAGWLVVFVRALGGVPQAASGVAF